MKSLSFKAIDAAPVRSGAKTCSMRFGKRATFAVGERMQLRFGQRNKPAAILEATCTENVSLDLTEPLEILSEVRTVADDGEDAPLEDAPLEDGEPSDDEISAMTSSETLDYLERYGDVDSELLRALRASGGDYTALILEAMQRETTEVAAVYFQVEA